MPTALQTRSRANRIKLFKKYYRHHGPSFRCTHGSRLPPRALAKWESLYSGAVPHRSKFLSSGIKWTRPVKEKKKVPKLLSKKLKAAPLKRKKRGKISKVGPGKKKVVVKTLKPKKRVSFAKKGAVYKRREQEAVEITHEARYGRAPVVGGTKGDPKTMFKLDAQGRLIQVARKPRKIIYG